MAYNIIDLRKVINRQIYDTWYDQPILHDEDHWNGKYKTYGEMWNGEGYTRG